MKKLRLVQSNRWRHVSQVGGAIGLATLLLLTVLWRMEANKIVPTVLAAPANQEIGVSSSVITIGATVPLTEPGSVSGGEAMKAALEIAADEINAAGGVLGLPIRLVISDTAGTPQLGAEAMDYFNQVGAAGVVGEYHSSVGLTMTEKAREYHLPVIFAETWHDNITTVGYTEVFRIAPASSMVNEGEANYVAELGFNNVVIMTDDSGLGQALATSLESALTAKGVGSQTFSATVGTTNFSSVISDIQALNPAAQAVIVLLSGDDAYNFEQQSAQAGLAPSANTVCIDSRGNLDDSSAFWQKVPNGNYCVFRHIGPVQAHYNNRTFAFATEYMSRTGKSSVESYALEAYDSLIIMADAISRAGSIDPNAVVAAIEATDLVGAQGRYYFPYGNGNPVPGGMPAYMWHQWPDPYILMLQYFEVNQTPDDAAIVYPPRYRNHGLNLIPYGGTVSQTISTIYPLGGKLASNSSSTTITFGPNVLTTTTVITYTPFSTPSETSCVSNTLTSPGNHYFHLTATDSNTGQPVQPAANMSYTVVVSYTDNESSVAIEDTIGLYWCDGSDWSQEGITSTVNVTDNIVGSSVGHFSDFAILGQSSTKIYLPIILKDSS